jgi:hypothetical protein
MPGDHSNDRNSFLTIFDNVLTAGGLDRGQRASWLALASSRFCGTSQQYLQQKHTELKCWDSEVILTL